MSTHRLIPSLLLVLVLGLASGCAALVVGAGAGAGVVAYKMGELVANVDQPIAAVSKAADKGLAELKLPIVSKEESSLTVTILTRDTEDTKIEITLKSLTATSTAIHIRVGTFGDEAKSMRVHSAITDHLPKAGK